MPKFIKIPCVITLALILGLPQIQPVSSGSCKNLYIVFARGSGDVLNGENYQNFKTSMNVELKKTGLNYEFYELGSVSQGGHRYAAAGIGLDSLNGVLNSVGAFVSGGESYVFGHSVKEGELEIAHYIENRSKSCPTSRYILAGYSQGAQVVSGALKYLDSSKIIYAATFGDPKLYLPEGLGNSPIACRDASAVSDYRVYVPDCKALSGILRGRNPYVSNPSSWLGKVGTWCNYHDIMCSSKIDTDDIMRAHTSYVSDRRYADAATLIAEKVRAYFHLQSTENAIKSSKDVVFVIDNSNATPRLLAEYRSQATALAKIIIAGGGRFALYDFNGAAPRELCSFQTCSYETFLAKLGNIQPNTSVLSILSAIRSSMDTQIWTVGSNKQIVTFTNNGLHFGGISRSQIVKRSLEIDPVHINIVSDSEEVLNDPEILALTSETGGQTYEINHFTILEDANSWKPEGTIYDDGKTRQDFALTYEYEIQDNKVRITLGDNAEKVLLIVNDVLYGLLTEKEFIITDFDLTQDNNISLVPFNENGERGTASEIIVTANGPGRGGDIPDLDLPDIGTPATGFAKENH